MFRARQTRYYAIGMDFAELEAGIRLRWRIMPNPLVFTRTVWPPHTLCENREFAIDERRRWTQDARMASLSTPQDRLEALLDEIVGSGPMRLLLDEAIIRVMNSVEATAQERGSHNSASTQVMSSRT